ncbi:MAG TPA: lipoyl(octanoyl) transferase LipB [bacterium]|nr:lipoyl(octanoyl) transferase LipB [bacterium]
MGPLRGWLLDLLGSPAAYADIWTLQRGLVAARQAGSVPDTLILLEHAPVVTIGRSGKRSNLLGSPDALIAQGIEVFDIERGGDVTYHGPGQMVGYPILDLRALNEDIVRFMRALEGSVIATLEDFGITASRERGFPGVWVDGAKICAVGVAVRRRVTMHGFALNVNTDLDAFSVINPCGLGRPVTSIARLLGHGVDVAEVGRVYAGQFASAFGIELARVDRAVVDDALAREAAVAHG